MARFQENDLPKAKLTKTALAKTKQLFGFGQQHLWKYYLGLVFLVCTGATALAFPKLMGLLVDCVKNHDADQANQLALLLMGILVFQSFFSFFRISLFVNFTEHTLANIRQSLYGHLLQMPMAFYAQKRVGELNSRISADVGQIQDTLTTTLAEFLRQFILIIGGVIMLGSVSMKLTLLMLSIVPVVAVAAVVFGRFIRKFARQVQDSVAESQVIVEETLQGIALVKAFANEPFEWNRYRSKLNDIVGLAIKGGQMRGYFAFFIIFCLFGAIVAVVWYGVTLSIQGELSVGQLISFVLYSTFVGASFGGVAELYAQIQKAVGATERLFELLDEPIEHDLLQSVPDIQVQGHLQFNQIDFSYPTRTDVQVLHDVHFEVKAGQKIALVGPSGAGKSTIASLLFRFYEPTSGHILLDGQPLSDYPLQALRRQMSIVPQDVFLFGGSIRENIAYGKPDATQAELDLAAQRAHALEFIERFPEGWDTVVGERGVKLSGGQRQRIAIARALLNNPRILILDEATSALDSESEKSVQAALETLMEGRTTLIIAHRLSTIREADAILVIDRGTVVEQGTHTELMQLEQGVYKTLSQLQFQDH